MYESVVTKDDKSGAKRNRMRRVVHVLLDVEEGGEEAFRAAASATSRSCSSRLR